jgi:DNA-binding GntR family transcriptional regulator
MQWSGLVIHSSRRRPLLADVVRAELSKAIINGEFPLGSKLPNEEQLRDRFDVSRITLREAVQGLIQDGYVIRRQGSGTYVTRRPSLKNSLDTNFSYTEYLEQSGVRAGKKLIGIRRVPAGDEAAEALAVELDTPLVEVRRVRTADGRAAMFSIDYLPLDIVDPTRDRKALAGSIYRLLTRKGHPVDHGEAIVAPAIADAKLAQHLDVAEGTLLQHVKQVDFDAHERAVMLSLEWHVPSVIELRVYRRGPGPLADTSS